MMRYFKKIGGGLKRITTLFIITFFLFNIFMISPEPLSFTSPVNAIRYDMEVNVSVVDASLHGETSGDWLGCGWGVTGITGSGDVNGDGYDDILIGAIGAGKTYLFFGKAEGWSMDMNLSNADATFVGENVSDRIGHSVGIIGDVNNDTYDDILISATRNDTGGNNAGQVYLIFGKTSGWTKDTNLSTADASFIGEAAYDYAGVTIAGAGDVNGDGFNDILIGAYYNMEGGDEAGQAYLIFGKASGWSMDNNLSNSDASFLGERNYSWFGYSIAGVGDVNNDGLDDILISDRGPYYAPGLQENRAYLFYGKASGWAMDTKETDANVIFIEGHLSNGMLAVAGKGDVNEDGIADIIIGAMGYSHQTTTDGRTSIFFGQRSGWPARTRLNSANASFVGDGFQARLGMKVDGSGDVNGDGFDDILISAEHVRSNPEVYLVLGKVSGWSKNTSISSSAAASFLSESVLLGDYYGYAIAMAGDVNCDGFDDILISAFQNDEGGNNAGQVYLIFPELDKGPQTVNSVKVYSDPGFTNEINIAEIGDTVYVKLTAMDKNATHIDNAAVNISSTLSSPEGFWLYLLETGFNTGKYHGSFKITNRTHPYIKLINATIGEYVTISSVMDPTKNATILVSTPVQLRPFQDKPCALEDEEYFMHYWNFGYNTVSAWTFDTNASWLTWDEVNHDIYGTPNNGDVGSYWVLINITDGLDNYDEHNFTITVNNMPPNITTENTLIAMEDELYYIDYTSSDDDQGIITWHLETNASWLDIDPSLGMVSGTPTNEERGLFWANVSVNDGNGGIDWSYFEISVFDTNDAPVIITENVTTVYEDEFYSVQYNATDIDGEKSFEWYLDTNASWLNMNKDSGELYGTPTNDHVGISYVNVSVKDPRDGHNSQNFTLEVLNVNDPPEWVTVPEDSEVPESKLFIFDVDATDIDSGDILTYFLKSYPITDITIDSDTGLIEWVASIEDLETPQYALEITLSVTDGEETIWTFFDITVIPNSHPTTKLLSPADGSLVSAKGIELKWSGHDEENEYLTYDLYLSKDETSVFELLSTAKVLSGTNATSYLVEGLAAGSIYYWTVITKDWLHYGECLDGIFSFKINSPPRIRPISSQKATVGLEFRLEIEASDSNPGDIQNFEYSLDSTPEGMTIELSIGVITWTPTKAQVGQHTVKVWVSDGLDQTNVSFEIEVNEKIVENKSSMPIMVTTTFFVVLLIILFSFIGGTDLGKYKFLSLIFVPMYNRLHPDNIFDNYTRGQIHGYIKAKPGEHYNAIKKALELKNGILAHHLRILEKEGFVNSKRDGFHTSFYSKGTKVPESVTPKLNNIQKNLVNIIRTQPGITQHEIISLLNLSQQVVSYNLTNLMRYNIIKIEHDGRENMYYINYESSELPQP